MESKIILTNMCMLYDNTGKILVQNRVKNDWPGINFPGGHVKPNESIIDSVYREMKEETGLEVFDLQFVNFYEWNIPSSSTRHLVLLYKSNNFKGELKSSSEGTMMWIKKEDCSKYKQSTDFEKLLAVYFN